MMTEMGRRSGGRGSRSSRRALVGATGLCGLLIPLAVFAPAQAEVPGINGDIAFQSTRDLADCCRIYTMNEDGSDVQSPLFTLQWTYDPAWSPDGTQLAFTSIARRGNFEIYVMETQAGPPGPRLEMLTKAKGRDTSPAWSPDGTKLAFISTRTGNYDVWRMTADGDSQVDISNSLANDCGCFDPFNINAQPAYSPDGTEILFTSDIADPGNNLDIFVMDEDGSNVRRLTEDLAVDAEADWSPDGTQIAFASDRDGDMEIFIMDADGGLQQMTHNTVTDTQPDWSPGGDRLAFTSERDGNAEIYVMDADGTEQQNLTNNPAEDERPDWR